MTGSSSGENGVGCAPRVKATPSRHTYMERTEYWNTTMEGDVRSREGF